VQLNILLVLYSWSKVLYYFRYIECFNEKKVFGFMI